MLGRSRLRVAPRLDVPHAELHGQDRREDGDLRDGDAMALGGGGQHDGVGEGEGHAAEGWTL